MHWAKMRHCKLGGGVIEYEKETEEQPVVIKVDGEWRLAADFVTADALTALIAATATTISDEPAACAGGKLCDNKDPHPIASCPYLHSLDQKVLVNKEYLRLRTLEPGSRAFLHLLANPSHRGVLCGSTKGLHDPMHCNFVHLRPHVIVGVEKFPIADLLRNAAILHLIEVPQHRGRWCTNTAPHDVMACAFVHWRAAGGPRKPPPKRPAAFSPTLQRKPSVPRTDAEDDALLEAHMTKQKQDATTSTAFDSCAAAGDSHEVGLLVNTTRYDDDSRRATRKDAPGVQAGTVITMGDVLPKSTCAQCAVAVIVLVISWLFAS